jgi:hypothetical protein
MKNIVRAVIAAALIFTATESFASGFSVGLFGAYSINGGPIEDTINNRHFLVSDGGITIAMPDSTISYDEIIIPGAGLFTSYTFRNGFSIRTGAEFYTLISGGNISNDIHIPTVVYYYNKYEIEYNSYAVPLLLGIALSPDKGRTNIYAYGGMVLAMTDISQYYSYTAGTPPTEYEYKSENEAIVPGFAALIGAERRLFSRCYVMLEFAFYRCETSKKEWGAHYKNDSYQNDYSYTERYGLPRQQVRIGLRYSF